MPFLTFTILSFQFAGYFVTPIQVIMLKVQFCSGSTLIELSISTILRRQMYAAFPYKRVNYHVQGSYWRWRSAESFNWIHRISGVVKNKCRLELNRRCRHLSSVGLRPSRKEIMCPFVPEDLTQTFLWVVLHYNEPWNNDKNLYKNPSKLAFWR